MIISLPTFLPVWKDFERKNKITSFLQNYKFSSTSFQPGNTKNNFFLFFFLIFSPYFFFSSFLFFVKTQDLGVIDRNYIFLLVVYEVKIPIIDPFIKLKPYGMSNRWEKMVWIVDELLMKVKRQGT